MTASGALAFAIHAALMMAAALALAGLVPWAMARLEGRTGPPPLQPWHTWWRLLRKQPVRPESASPSFAAAPLICLATTAVAALLVPSFSLGMLTTPAADLLVIAGLLALARAVMSLAALDTGTAPGGLAAATTLRAGALAEPALLVAALTLGLLSGSTNLGTALLALREAPMPGLPVLLVVAGLVAIVAAGEAEGDGLLAGFSGWHRAAAEAAMALRRVVWLSLLAALWLPASLAVPGFDALGWVAAMLAWAAKLLVLGALCALGGPALRRLLRQPVPSLLGAGALLVLLGLLFLLTGGDLV